MKSNPSDSLEHLRRQIRKIERSSTPPEPNLALESDRQAVREAIKRRLRNQAPAPPSDPWEIPVPHNRPPSPNTVLLQHAVPGVPVQAPHGGSVYLAEERLEAGSRYCDLVNERFLLAFQAPQKPAGEWLAAQSRSDAPIRPEDLVFFDLETTGLRSCPLFLIGAMTFEKGGLVVRQYLARNYSEEAAAVSLFAHSLAERRLYVSFNGKSFDAPFLRARAEALGIPIAEPPAHLDLLHASRRRWGARFPNCRLQTLEYQLFGRQREDDVPSRLIPEVYRRFVRTGNAADMAGVIKHNKLDLITLAELIVCLAQQP